MTSCSAIDLAEIRRYSKVNSWVSLIISGLFTVLGRPGRGASQVEKSPRLNWATQFLTVAYDGAYSPNVSVRMAWISFGALPCRKKKTWKQLASWCYLNHARRLTCFLSASVRGTTRTRNKKRLAIRHNEQTHLYNDTIDSVQRHWEVGRAKDLSALPTYVELSQVCHSMSIQMDMCTENCKNFKLKNYKFKESIKSLVVTVNMFYVHLYRCNCKEHMFYGFYNFYYLFQFKIFTVFSVHIHLYTHRVTNLQQFCLLGMIQELDDCFIQLCTVWRWASKTRHTQDFAC